MQGITGVNEKVRLKMTIIDSSIFCGNSTNYMMFDKPNGNIQLYLGILNSKLLNYIFNKFSTNSNVNGYEVDNLPIPRRIEKDEKQRISTIVENILKKKISNPKTDTTILEAQIDQIVYSLYGLAKKEIESVENFYKMQNR